MTGMRNAKIAEISGAGPAGLAAALAVIRSGGSARVYERRSDVGARFHGDFQGLENWTTDVDALDELESLGIAPNFDHSAFNKVLCFGPRGVQREVCSRKPLFYMVRRGSEPGTLDYGLKQQLLDAGGEIRVGQTLRRLPQGGIVTEGPRRADAIAVGYLFETDMEDSAFAVVSEELAPRGYGYLLVCKGRATLATCLFTDFHNQRRYLQRCVDFFVDKTGVRVEKARPFGGTGNFSIPKSPRKGNIVYAGEAAGFQDPLFGFGIRWALLSGAAAGRSLAARCARQYEVFWKRRLRNFHKTGACNRWIYDRLGDRGYYRLLRHYPDKLDIRTRLRHAYATRLWKRIWYDLVVSHQQKPLLKLQNENCDCTWCRCRR